jgi:glycosyltransferase involved in cell wall biosynthesis
MGKPLVSIIVPCHATTPRHGALLDETLQTVSRQTCRDYEVVVVDDGSPIDIAPLVRARGDAILVRHDNAGPAIARNSGIARSRGEYLVFLDADDHLLPVALEACLAAFDTDPECGFVVGPHEEMTFDGEPVPWRVVPPPRQRHLHLPLLAFDWYIIPPSSAMFRRDAVLKVGGFQDPWGADDLDFYLRMAHGYAAVCFDAPAVTRYRRYSSSSSRDGERMLRSVRTVYARQWPLVQGDPAGEAAFDRGLAQLTEIFRDCLVENVQDRLRTGDRHGALRSARFLAQESPDRWSALVGQSSSPVREIADEVSI